MLDPTDQRIIRALDRDARISIKELSTLVGLSSPSVSERLRRLEQRGVIAAFTIRVSPDAIGYILQGIVRVRSMPGMLRKVEQLIQQTPEVVQCDKVTGDDDFVCRIYVKSMAHLDKILDRFHDCAHLSTSMIKTSPVKHRLPPLE
jgi:Lrp/AsnC family transcriptional regulator, leucine-responsive regulatory protein